MDRLAQGRDIRRRKIPLRMRPARPDALPDGQRLPLQLLRHGRGGRCRAYKSRNKSYAKNRVRVRPPREYARPDRDPTTGRFLPSAASRKLKGGSMAALFLPRSRTSSFSDMFYYHHAQSALSA
jgi:hypothetical protein